MITCTCRKVAVGLVLAGLMASFNLAQAKHDDHAGKAASAAAAGESNVEICRQFIDEVFNKGNMDFAKEHMSKKIKDHDPFPGQESGIEGFIKGSKEFRTAFPDGVTKIKEIFGAGDIVTIVSTFSGTNSGPLWGAPATGKKAKDVEIIDVVRFDDGKAVEHWGQMDVMKMMTQLGQLPAPGDAK